MERISQSDHTSTGDLVDRLVVKDKTCLFNCSQAGSSRTRGQRRKRNLSLEVKECEHSLARHPTSTLFC